MATITSPSPDGPQAAGSHPPAPVTAAENRLAFGPLALAGLASVGGGAIHAAAIGVHADHQAAARTFAVLAVAQLTWGVIGLVGRRPAVAFAGLGINAAAVGGWVLAKTQGISFIAGLGDVEAIQWSDFLAAGLGALAVLGSLRVLVTGGRGRLPGRSALNAVGLGVVAISLLALTEAGTHTHLGSDGHDHGTGSTAALGPFDPTLPLDLGGVTGVTRLQQTRAEQLVAGTLDSLPTYADADAAAADGYVSLGDGLTGHEHFINWSYVTDDLEVDPDHPESLVYGTGPDGARTLVAARFMLAPGTSLDEVPDLGGELTQWRVEDDLCLAEDPAPPHVAGVTSVDGTCRAPQRKVGPSPTIYVWITPQPCGPFAALQGAGDGSAAAADTSSCGHAHGA